MMSTFTPAVEKFSSEMTGAIGGSTEANGAGSLTMSSMLEITTSDSSISKGSS